MKKLIVFSLTAVMSLGLSAGAFAAEKKAKAAAPGAFGTPVAADATKPAAEAKADKPMAMYARVDSIDAAGKTFTMKRKKDGKEIKHRVGATTEIKNEGAAAKFADIKVGDWVGGLRIKKSETEYEVVKITKFGPRKAKAAKKADEAKPEERD